MKHLPIAAFLLLCQVCFGQQVEMATSITPEDIGAYKWILSGTAQENDVVIFRVTTVSERHGNVTTKIYDTVCYSPGKKRTGSAFFIDPNYFDSPRSAEPKWHFRALGSSGWINGRFAGYSSNDNQIEIKFESEKSGKTKMILETFIESYEDASKLYSNLPPISLSPEWSWAGSPKERNEQDAPLNAD